MKQWLVVLLVAVAALQPMHAEDAQEWANNETAWNVIRERFFNGENSNVFRFESDIRLKVDGAETHQDSAVFVQLVAELNQLLETVQVSLVQAEPNLTLTVTKQQKGLSNSAMKRYNGNNIEYVMLNMGFTGEYSDSASVKLLYFNIIRDITNMFTPQGGSTTWYGGIFDASKPADATFTDIDKAILKQVYSHDFYKNLRINTVKKQGVLSYFDLRYKKLMKNLSYTFKVLLLLFGFLFLLSRESKRKKQPKLGTYIKQWALIPLLFPFFYSGFNITGMLVFNPFVLVAAFLVNYVGMAICGFLVLVCLYYIEPIFLKRMTNFVWKQVFVFSITFISAKLVQALLFLLFSLAGHLFVEEITLITFRWYGTVPLLQIASLAALRVFYNVIQFRIQSMVNQKDVEIAKMKELKNQAELNALHSRINPHFLYNALNSIASLAHIDAGKTENMALGLSELFRYSINKENKTYVSVDEELSMVNKYLDIEKTRFGDRLEYEIKVDEGARELQIPKFLIQPLVENAVKHGVSNDERKR